MPTITRSKTRLEHPSDLVTSTRDGVMNRPRNVVISQQDQAVVTRAARNGSPLTSFSVPMGLNNLQVLQSQNA